MSTDSPTAVIAEGGFAELREIARALAERGLASEVVRPPAEQCSS